MQNEDLLAKEYVTLIDLCVSQLKTTTFSELQKMDELTEDVLEMNGKSLSLLTAKEMLSNDELKVIVEIHCPSFMGSQSTAKGFAISSSGAFRELLTEEFW